MCGVVRAKDRNVNICANCGVITREQSGMVVARTAGKLKITIINNEIFNILLLWSNFPVELNRCVPGSLRGLRYQRVGVLNVFQGLKRAVQCAIANQELRI